MTSEPSHSKSPVVLVDDLRVRFVSRDLDLPVVSGVSFALHPHETLCLLGESGSGKSVTMRALMRLLPETAHLSGRIVVDGQDVLALDEPGLRALRGKSVAMIFQEPMTALDPVFTVGRQIAETVVCHEGVSYGAADRRALELLEMVQVPSAKRRLAAYPHELSGGLRQRMMIAMALACRPKVLLADEPTTALDATVQIQILLLLRELQKELGMATIVVTHDLGVACETADRVAVMYAGRFVETGPVEALMEAPRHPYTLGLLNATVHGQSRGARLKTIVGAPPDLAALPPGCSFAPRCGDAWDTCTAETPHARMSGGRMVRCHKYNEAGLDLLSATAP
ncbi:ABC transporter ATP-binding protein [Xanthobacter sp. KR7-65]|uniref:ABC transporter ATP-binding protein n=1 Tax=Xanthobacter sp. KR7-65 TaxID=3156612 RepID=UPI0032B3C4A2